MTRRSLVRGLIVVLFVAAAVALFLASIAFTL